MIVAGTGLAGLHPSQFKTRWISFTAKTGSGKKRPSFPIASSPYAPGEATWSPSRPSSPARPPPSSR